MANSDGGKSVKPQALDAMVKASGGYAYMVQLVGYYSWLASAAADEISLEHAQAGTGVNGIRPARC